MKLFSGRSLTATKDGRLMLHGLVAPLDQEGTKFYLQHGGKQTELLLDSDAQIGLEFREKNTVEMLQRRTVTVGPGFGNKKNDDSLYISFTLPTDLYAKVRFKDFAAAQQAIGTGVLQGGFMYATPLPDHLPTATELWFSGRISEIKEAEHTPDKMVKIGDRVFTVQTAGWHINDQIVGQFKLSDIVPFENEATVYGLMKDNVFHASEVLLCPIPNLADKDAPQLPRYLYIGDSISGNYGDSLRVALAGKLNAHHPPVNCGPSGKGRDLMMSWLGNYKAPGRQWDVISFNFGHWDAGNTKAAYQANLESVITQLKETKAKLIWVTTCEIPNGYPPAGELKADGEAPGRTAGVMKKYLDPWALEVMRKHPEISICDQWQFVYDHREDLYKEWWAGENVHFKTSECAGGLGKLLAEHVLKVMKNE